MSEPAQSQQAPPTLGEPGEPCGRCGAALAPDQRYCLNCGRRRAEPRVDFRRHLKSEKTAALEPAKDAEATSGAPPTAGDGAKPQRDYAPLAAAGGIAVLGIMLLIGVLIGRGTGTPESSAPPQVVTVPDASGGTASGGGAGGGSQGGDKAAGSKGAKKNTANGGVAGGSAGTGSAPVVSDDALQGLEEQSGESYSDASSKLPDEIATPGAPPPEDSKAPGGGSGGTTIE